jgi:hypothetical protein
MEKQPFDDFVIYEKVPNPRTNIYGKSMPSTNNSRINNENGGIAELSLDEALKVTSYPNYLKDFIKQFLIDNYSDSDIAKVFMLKDSETIFVIEYALTIELNERNYKVYVLVYLPILFPNYPPEFYIEKTAPLGLNRVYNGKISIPDFKINLENFVNFDPNKNNIGEIIDNLVINFSQEFPIFKDNSSNNNNWIKSGKCVLEKRKVSSVRIPKKQNNYYRPKTDIRSDNNYNYNNNGLAKSGQNYYGNVKTEKLIDNNKDEFTDKTFLDFIRKQTKDIVTYNYLEFKEKHNFGANMDKLKILQDDVNRRLNDGNIYGKNDQLKSRFQTLKNIKEKLEVIENNINQEINDIKNNDNKSFFDKFEDIVNVKNKKDLEYLAKIKDMEDYLVYLKKGYEKKIVSFEDMLSETRALSREIFNFNYMRSKINSQ